MGSPATDVSRLRPPPPHLGPHGAALWKAVVRDYEVNNEPQLVHLAVAAEALDRLEQCREIIKTEGLVLDDKRVGKIAHPLLKIENACRSAFQSAMRALLPCSQRGARRVTTAVLPFTPPRAKRSLMMRRWLLGGCGGAWVYLEKRDLREVWAGHEQAVVAHHVKRRPGTRPRLWWQYSAPEPRRRLGGIGSALHECSAYIAPFEYGIPSAWRLHGDYFTSGTPISVSDPPRFESEAKYLLRLGLLLPGERARLKPRDFWPERIEP